MFYGRAAGQDALFSLGLEYNEDDDWNLLPSKGGWVRPFLGGQGPKVLVFTILSAKRERRWSPCFQDHLYQPQGTISPHLRFGTSVQWGL